MAPDDPLRETLSLAAIAGGAVWGLYHLATTVLAGQPVYRQDYINALLNVAAAVITGGLVAYFLGPFLVPLIPIEGLREPRAAGFAIGVMTWEAVPFVFRWVRLVGASKTGGNP
jgi:hypothetical protein